MGLFDFLDVNGDTGAWDFAGAAAKGATEGMAAGEQRAATRQKSLMDLELAETANQSAKQKLGFDAFDFENKQRLQPLEDLLKAQDVNVIEQEPTPEHVKQAAMEVLGEDQAKWTPEAAALNKEKIEGRAKVLANANVPDMGSDEWLKYAQANTISDATLKRIQAQDEISKLLLKEEAKARAQKAKEQMFYDALGVKQELAADQIAAVNSRQNKQLTATEIENQKKASERDQARSDSRAQKLADKWKTERGRYAPSIFKNGKIADKDGAKALIRNYEAIRAAKSPKVMEEFMSVYGDDVHAILSKPGAPPKGKPKTATEAFDKRSAEADVQNYEDTLKGKEKFERDELRQLEGEFQRTKGLLMSRSQAERLDKLRSKYGKSSAKAETKTINGVTYKKAGSVWKKVQ